MGKGYFGIKAFNFHKLKKNGSSYQYLINSRAPNIYQAQSGSLESIAKLLETFKGEYLIASVNPVTIHAKDLNPADPAMIDVQIEHTWRNEPILGYALAANGDQVVQCKHCKVLSTFGNVKLPKETRYPHWDGKSSCDGDMMNLGNFILSDDNGSWYVVGEKLICYSPSGSVGYRFDLADYPTVESDQKIFTAVCEFAVAKKKLRSVTPVTYQSINANH